MTANKNILFLTDLHLWSLEKGKGGLAFFNTVKGYKNDFWNIWFVTSGGGVPENIIYADKLFEKKYSYLSKLKFSKIRIISIFARFFRVFLVNIFLYRTGDKILSKSKTNFFIIYAYEIGGVYAAKKLSKKYNLPLVTRFQGTIHSKTLDTMYNNISSYPHLSALKTCADITIMTNDGTQGLETLRRLQNNSKEVLFLRNGVNKISLDILDKREEFRKSFNLSNNFVFITISRLVNWKKVDRAIKAFSFVNRKQPNSKLIILGDGSEKENLISLSKELNVSDSVVFLGAVEQEDVKKYLIASDVFLSFYDLSNVGNPLMEAMMCGKAIITLNNGDTGELIENDKNGILIETDKIEIIPEKMNLLIENSDFREKISKGAFETASTQFWTWDERITHEINIIDKLLERNN
jgi:glycosyltransferase involved in cell wall biosynthesis